MKISKNTRLRRARITDESNKGIECAWEITLDKDGANLYQLTFDPYLSRSMPCGHIFKGRFIEFEDAYDSL